MVAGDGADVTPEAVVLVGVQALAGGEELRDDVVAEVVLGALVLGVLLQRLDQQVCVEDVDAHGREVRVGLRGLLGELEDLLVLVGRQDAEAGRLLPGHGHDRDGQVRVVALVVVEHLLVVHVVQLVAREDEDVLGVVLLDEAQVLRHGVSGARVPGATGLGGVRRQDEQAPVALVQVPGAAGAQVVVQEIRPVLSQDANGVDAGVGAVGQRKVDDAILPAERDGGLGDFLREDAEPAALAAGKKHCNAFPLAH